MQYPVDSDSDSDRILFNINEYWDRNIRLQNKDGGKSKIDQKPDMVNMHVGRPLLRSCLTAYIEATMGESTWSDCYNMTPLLYEQLTMVSQGGWFTMKMPALPV